MKLLNRLAGGLPFAHLAGISSRRIRSDQDADIDDDEDNRTSGRRADENDPDPQDPDQDRKGKKGRRAEADPDDENEDGSDDSIGDDEKGKRGRKAKRAEDDPDDPSAEDDDPDAEDDEDELKGKSAAARARRRERARCAAIFGSKAAARNPVLAANLAFGTSMSRHEALALLKASPAGESAGGASDGRASRNPSLGNSAGPSPSRQASVDARWERTMQRIGR